MPGFEAPKGTHVYRDYYSSVTGKGRFGVAVYRKHSNKPDLKMFETEEQRDVYFEYQEKQGA
jgi:hypothetical protein